MNNTVKIKELIQYTVPAQAKYKKITKIYTKNIKLIYLRHERKFVFDKYINDFTGEYYYKVYLLCENEKKEIIAYVNTLDEKLNYLDKIKVNRKYILKLKYYIIYDHLRTFKEITNYYIDKVKRS